ncbi:hypothetical protein J4558_14725 [Leptolyngbya sp. 15MV]|nr:hypothetical protein J4558_14725 [Leptolyngbya sp. 15MV]
MAVRHVGRPFPCGLFCYRCEPDLRHGVALTADHLVALDLLDPEVVRERLLRALATLAAELGCEMVRLAVPAAPLALLLRTGLGRPALAAERADRQGPGC